MANTNLVAAVQRWTFLVPLGVAFIVGLITWQHWTYFIVMSLLALGPAVFGCADPVGELIDYVGRERRRHEQARRERETVEAHAVSFLRQLQSQTAEELRLMAQCVIRDRNGFNRDAADPVAQRLLERGFAYAETGFTPAGYPFYFTDRTWVLMNALRDDIFAAHDKISSPPVTPPPVPKPRFDPFILAFDVLVFILKQPILFLVVLTGAGFAWFAWVIVLGAVILAMVSTGYAVRWLLGF